MGLFLLASDTQEEILKLPRAVAERDSHPGDRPEADRPGGGAGETKDVQGVEATTSHPAAPTPSPVCHIGNSNARATYTAIWSRVTTSSGW